MLKAFRYSGSKTRLLRYYKQPGVSTRRVVEPYLGSGAYGLNSGLPVLGYEINRDLVALWVWLKQVTVAELVDLNRQVEDYKKRTQKPDVRDMSLSAGAEVYVRVNVCSVVVGQLSSWKVYPQHRLPIEDTIACLARLKDLEVVYGLGETYQDGEGDWLFVDPPYAGTRGNYIAKGGTNIDYEYDPRTTEQLVCRTHNPLVFTYGTEAPAVFPFMEWSAVTTSHVPNMRTGGRKERTEHVAYRNIEGVWGW